MSEFKATSISPVGPFFSPMVQGYWRLDDWQMTPQQRLSFLKSHIDLGITTVDHADIYGDYRCETLFGQAVKLDPSVRKSIQVVSKCDIKLVSEAAPNRKINHYDTSYHHILESVDHSLKRLGVEKLDVLLLHRSDALMDADEVAEAFTTLRYHGKVAHFGVSNFTPSQFDLLQSRWDESLVTNQVEINPLRFDVIHDGTLDQLQRLQVKPMAWSCLAGGELLTGESQQAVRVRETLSAIGEELGGVSIDQVIYAWVMRHPSKPLPIIGSGNIERVKAAKQAYDLKLTREQWYRIWVASKGHNVP